MEGRNVDPDIEFANVINIGRQNFNISTLVKINIIGIVTTNIK